MPQYDTFREMQAQETDECIEWPFNKNKLGYGYVSWLSRSWTVHRLSCEIAHGVPPAKAHAAHSCRNRACFNPRHLRWATVAENAADRTRDESNDPGAPGNAAKLTAQEVITVRALHRLGMTYEDLAETYRMTKMNMRLICERKTWRWVA